MRFEARRSPGGKVNYVAASEALSVSLRLIGRPFGCLPDPAALGDRRKGLVHGAARAPFGFVGS